MDMTSFSRPAQFQTKEERQLYYLKRHNARLRDLVVLEQVVAIKDAIQRIDDVNYARQLWNELESNEQIDLWVRESKGGIFTKAEQEILK